MEQLLALFLSAQPKNWDGVYLKHARNLWKICFWEQGVQGSHSRSIKFSDNAELNLLYKFRRRSLTELDAVIITWLSKASISSDL